MSQNNRQKRLCLQFFGMQKEFYWFIILGNVNKSSLNIIVNFWIKWTKILIKQWAFLSIHRNALYYLKPLSEICKFLRLHCHISFYLKWITVFSIYLEHCGKFESNFNSEKCLKKLRFLYSSWFGNIGRGILFTDEEI